LQKILVQQEKEFSFVLKKQQKMLQKMGAKAKAAPENKYELQSLLEESSSEEEDSNQPELSEDEESTPIKGQAHEELL
jgi:hypothetical protein